MRRFLIAIAVSAGVAVLIAATSPARLQADSEHNHRVAITDDCDQTDLTWGDVGGCFKAGTVTRAEFGALLASPLSPTTVVGHPSWRIDPGLLVIEAGERLRVRNTGGRAHTFTEVAQFGGGKIPPPAGTGLNRGLITAPECPTSVDIAAGERGADVKGLAVGLHKFQCCIHPWMRGTVRVVADGRD
jgi:plastocyanin